MTDSPSRIGKVPLATSKTFKDPFESGHTDVFDIEAMDIGEPTKIKYVPSRNEHSLDRSVAVA